MTENLSVRDLVVRVLLALGLALIAVRWVGDLRIAGPAALAVVCLAGTVLTRRCPFYALLGIRSRRVPPPPAGQPYP